LKNESTILPWLTVYEDWARSLRIIENNTYKNIPGCICSFCHELLNINNTFEDSAALKSCQQWYDNFYERNFDLQFAERVKQLEENIFSSQKMSELLQNNCVLGKRIIASEGEASDGKRIRYNVHQNKYYDSDEEIRNNDLILIQDDDDYDYDYEDVPLHDLIQKESGWVLSTSRDVKDILKSIVENEINSGSKQNKKPTPEQKALRRHIASKIIDFTSTMNDYFTDVERQDIIHSINVTEFNNDINDFIKTVEKVNDCVFFFLLFRY